MGGAVGLGLLFLVGLGAIPPGGHPNFDVTLAPRLVKLGIELPQSGNEDANGTPTKNGVLLAIKQANAKNTVPGYTLADNNQDDAVNGVHDPTKGADNMRILVADTAVMGVVGPFNSGVAQAEIPVSNEAGLAQCSPANTGTDLTQDGSDVYRFNGQAKRNYFRVAAPDNILGPAMASFDYYDLRQRRRSSRTPRGQHFQHGLCCRIQQGARCLQRPRLCVRAGSHPSLKDTASAAGSDLGKWRGLVRDYIFDTAAHHTYDTVMGPISFDILGDIEQPVMSFYEVDTTLNSNAGGWVYVKQETFGPGVR